MNVTKTCKMSYTEIIVRIQNALNQGRLYALKPLNCILT